MRKSFITVALILLIRQLHSQPEHEKIIYDPSLGIDHITEYTWSAGTSEWIKKNSIKYEYSDVADNRQTVTTSDYDSGLPISRTIRYFESDNNRNVTLYQSWISGEWKNTRRDLYLQDEIGLTIETLIQAPVNGEWQSGTRYTDYLYEGSRLSKYTCQYWRNNQWTDIYYDTWYYNLDNILTERLQIWINNTPLNRFIYLLNENNQRQSLILYNWGKNKWVENYRRLYEYNSCGTTTSVIYQVYKNGAWVNSSRQEYFYFLNPGEKIPGQRIPVCHNGITIYVSLSAVDSHLEHGDCIGECLSVRKHAFGKPENLYSDTPPFTLYPNPAKESVAVRLDQSITGEMNRIELTDIYGKLLKSINTKDNPEVIIPRGDLLSGQYYIRITGNKVYSQVLIFD